MQGLKKIVEDTDRQFKTDQVQVEKDKPEDEGLSLGLPKKKNETRLLI